MVVWNALEGSGRPASSVGSLPLAPAQLGLYQMLSQAAGQLATEQQQAHCSQTGVEWCQQGPCKEELGIQARDMGVCVGLHVWKQRAAPARKARVLGRVSARCSALLLFPSPRAARKVSLAYLQHSTVKLGPDETLACGQCCWSPSQAAESLTSTVPLLQAGLQCAPVIATKACATICSACPPFCQNNG